MSAPESPINRALRIIREELVCASIVYDDQAEKNRVSEALKCLTTVETFIDGLRKEYRDEMKEAQRDCANAFAEGQALQNGRGEW